MKKVFFTSFLTNVFSRGFLRIKIGWSEIHSPQYFVTVTLTLQNQTHKSVNSYRTLKRFFFSFFSFFLEELWFKRSKRQIPFLSAFFCFHSTFFVIFITDSLLRTIKKVLITEKSNVYRYNFQLI